MGDHVLFYGLLLVAIVWVWAVREGAQRERTNEPSKWGPRLKLIGGNIGGAKGFFPLSDGQRWYGRRGVHVPDSWRKLNACTRTCSKISWAHKHKR